MRGVFDDEKLETAPRQRDTELTLGSGTLLAIFFALVLLSGLCFGLGYSVGHRGAKTAPVSATATTPGEQEPLQANENVPKPSAIAQGVVVPPPAASNAEAPTITGSAPAAATQETTQSVAPARVQETQVRPALVPGANSPEPQQSASAVRPAIAQAGTIMVQVAAVANPDDADVLMNALRKRSYPVAARRDPADNLIHVRVGPFTTLGEAEQWKMKLLNDGYNAIVQP